MFASVALIMALTLASEMNQPRNNLINGRTSWTGDSAVILLALAVFGVQLRGLYLYAYKRKNLWKAQRKDM